MGETHQIQLLLGYKPNRQSASFRGANFCTAFMPDSEQIEFSKTAGFKNETL